jgi:hypothetical protein
MTCGAPVEGEKFNSRFLLPRFVAGAKVLGHWAFQIFLKCFEKLVDDRFCTVRFALNLSYVIDKSVSKFLQQIKCFC